jgi:hypothetical protein
LLVPIQIVGFWTAMCETEFVGSPDPACGFEREGECSAFD